ncbi:hypothetical protein ACFLUV_06690, partial [Elusimicrobiota bacterium]
KDKNAKKFLKDNDVYDEQVIAKFRLGFSDGRLINTIPSKGAVKDTLIETGILTGENKDYFEDCIVVPVFDQDDDIIDMIGLNITDKKLVTLSEKRRGVINYHAFQKKEIIISTDILIGFKIFGAGFDNVVPVVGLLNDEHMKFLRKHRPSKIYLATEDKNIITQLTKQDLPCFQLEVSEKITEKSFEKALEKAVPVATKIGEGLAKVTDNKIIFEFGQRNYEVKAMDDISPDRLKVNIRAIGKRLFHIDTIDLYYSRSRVSFIRQTAKMYELDEGVIESDICSMIKKLEDIRDSKNIKGDSEDNYKMTIYEEEEALEFLKQPNLLETVSEHLSLMGYIGEDSNKKLGYLITISRKLDNPLSGVVISRSGAGKSKLMEYLSDFVPEEDVVHYTRLTPQALYYQGERSLKHKLLIAGEEEGITGANYPLRELISSKKLKLGSPMKDPVTGRMKTIEYEVEGPISLLFSTSKPAINYENSNRCFVLSLDETKGQTERILNSQNTGRMLEGMMHKIEGKELIRLHQNAQRLLKKILVVNPFADQLSFPSHWIETRREHDKYLSLIDAIAFLNQYQRELKTFSVNGKDYQYIEVVPEDVASANKLISDILGTSINELSKPSRELLKMIKTMVDEKCKEFDIDQEDYRFNRRDVREYTGWSDNQIKSHIRQLEELQYILLGKGERGRMYKYELQYEGNGKKKHFFGLTDVRKLAKLGMVGQKLDSVSGNEIDDKIGLKSKVGHIKENSIEGYSKNQGVVQSVV